MTDDPWSGDDDQFTIEDEPDRTVPENVIVRGRLADLHREHVPAKGDRKAWDKLVWWFEVTGPPEYQGRKIRGQTSPKFSNHPSNRARAWAEALLQRPLAVNARVARSDLLQLPCEFTVRHDKGTDGRTWERVDEVIALTGAGVPDEPPF